MNHIDSYLIAFTDFMTDVKCSIELGGMEAQSVEKGQIIKATTAVLKAVAFTRNFELHNDSGNLSNLWMQAFERSNNASNLEMPEDLLSKPGASDNFSMELLGNKVLVNKLNDLEMICLDLQECLFDGHDNRRVSISG